MKKNSALFQKRICQPVAGKLTVKVSILKSSDKLTVSRLNISLLT